MLSRPLRNSTLLCFSLSALLLAGCPDKTNEAPQPDKPAEPSAPPKPVLHPEVAEVALDPRVPEDPARKPTPPKEPPARLATRYILVQYGDVSGATTTRSKEIAGQRAARLVQAARKQGADFLALAQKFSDVPADERGKQLLFSKGTMDPAFEQAALGLSLGQVSDAVETKFGFYVIQRVEPEEYSTAHILVQHKGAKNAASGLSRTKEEARARAEDVQKQAAKGSSFAVLAERYSDSPSRIRGGVIRPIVPGQMPADYDNYVEAVRALKVGGVSDVVETPFGFHVIKRLKLQRIRASHVLIAHNGAEVEPRERRTAPEAKRLALKVRRMAHADGADFAALAKKYSDDETTAEKGGDLGRFARGTMVPKIEQIAFGLKKGQVSDVVETKFGYHVIKRTE